MIRPQAALVSSKADADGLARKGNNSKTQAATPTDSAPQRAKPGQISGPSQSV
jgi:hypothetical protein